MFIIVYYNECRVHRALTHNPLFFLDMRLLLVSSALFRYSFHTCVVSVHTSMTN